jgi:hypothetical protein
MKIYYFEFTNENEQTVTEAYSSRTVAQQRITQIKKDTKILKQKWQDYIISNKRGERPPNYIRAMPSEIKMVEFETNKDGMLEAFLYLINRGNKT